jgi:hypothetical protein
VIKSNSKVSRRRLAEAASLGFGVYIAITSLIGIALGVAGWNGWLAISYGALGVSMGIAGIVAPRLTEPLRSALFGWFLLGLASRAVLEGDLYFWFISFPIAGVLVLMLALELAHERSIPSALWALGGGTLAVVSLVALAFVAPYMPAICPWSPTVGRTTMVLISYPGSTFPWDAAELTYAEQCLGR